MLEDKILYFYKSGLNFWNLAFKYFWKRSLLLASGSLLMFIIVHAWFPKYEAYLLLLALVSAFVAVFWIIEPTRKYIKEKYDCVYPSPDWDIFLCAALKRYLIKDVSAEESKENEALDFLISRLTKRLDSESKTSFLKLISNTTISFFIPVWSAFNAWWFKDQNNIFVIFHRMMGILIILVVGFLIINLLKWSFWNLFLKDISNHTNLKLLIKNLEHIRLSIKNPSYCKEIDDYLDKKGPEIELIIKEFDERYKNYAPDPIERFRRNVMQKLKNIRSINQNISYPDNTNEDVNNEQ